MQFTRTFKRAAMAGALLAGAVPLGAGALSFTITDLGALDDPLGTSAARGLSSNGMVTGWRSTTGLDRNAFLYDGSTMTVLGSLSGVGGRSTGEDVNSSGHVVGSSTSTDGGGAFLYDGTTMHNLGAVDVFTDVYGYYGTPGAEYSSSAAYGINESDSVVGVSTTDTAFQHAFLYDGTSMTMTDLGVLGVSTDEFGNVVNDISRAYDINDDGWATGSSSIAGTNHYNEHAFLYDGTTMTDLGTLAGSGSQYESRGDAINNNGWVAGESETASGRYRAFLYDGTTMMDLGSLGGASGDSTAVGLNDLGQVVGWSDGGISGRTAMLYDPSLGGMLDLNDLIDPLTGWQSDWQYLYRAWDINNAGQIVGEGYTIDGVRHAFLLNPEPVPEPTTLALLGLGAGILGARRRKRRGNRRIAM